MIAQTQFLVALAIAETVAQMLAGDRDVTAQDRRDAAAFTRLNRTKSRYVRSTETETQRAARMARAERQREAYERRSFEIAQSHGIGCYCVHCCQ